MAHDDVFFGFRLGVFDLAARTSVGHASRVFGVHRSTFYASSGRSIARLGHAATAGATPPGDADSDAADGVPTAIEPRPALSDVRVGRRRVVEVGQSCSA